MPNMELSGQIAIISGGLGDIGKAIAIELASHGADVAIGDILPDEEAVHFLSVLTSRFPASKVLYSQVDVSDPEAVESWYGTVVQALGIPALIVPNAAVVTLARIRELTPSQWQRDMRINLDGAFYMSQAGAKLLVQAQQTGPVVVQSYVRAFRSLSTLLSAPHD